MKQRSLPQRLLGFTLIELMIVVAILSVLAAIAVPAYGDYVKRAKVAELLNFAASAKTAINEYILIHNEYPASLEAAGITPVTSTYIQNISLTPTGLLTLEGNASTIGAPVILAFQATNQGANGISWQCKALAGATFAPSTCRENH